MSATTINPATGLPVSVRVTYRHNVNSRSLAAYRIELAPVAAEITDRLTGSGVVRNNTEHRSGVFATLEGAVQALHAFVDAPFTVWENDRTGELLVYSAEQRRRDGLTRIARSTPAGVLWSE